MGGEQERERQSKTMRMGYDGGDLRWGLLKHMRMGREFTTCLLNDNNGNVLYLEIWQQLLLWLLLLRS